MNSKLKFFSAFLSTFFCLFINANAQDVAMADAFRQDGKIYVVIAVVCVLFAVLFGYLIYLDNKINKLKK
ncbi:MAG: CcmD family protein [Bacteroidetes bacterium]|nr:CcmD family protein [Bacteroidota bacterium]